MHKNTTADQRKEPRRIKRFFRTEELQGMPEGVPNNSWGPYPTRGRFRARAYRDIYSMYGEVTGRGGQR